MARMIVGIYPFRCLQCGDRFFADVWLLSKLAFAKCPKCLSLELTIWPDKTFRQGPMRNLLLTLGAHRYRCPACRHYVLSFRPRKAGAVTLTEHWEAAVDKAEA